MSNVTEYNAFLPKAESIQEGNILKPGIPIEEFVYESEDLYRWCIMDKEALISAGIPETHFEDLNTAAGALRHAESNWNMDADAKRDAEQRWRDEEPAAEDLLNQLVHTFLYAYHGNASIINKVRDIAGAQSDADMIQGLNDLFVIGLNNPEPLQKINFKMDLLQEAEQRSGDMADLRAIANSEKYEATESLLIRNQIYTLLKGYVDDIRRCGKYVFWRNEARLKGYSSKYLREKNLRNRSN